MTTSHEDWRGGHIQGVAWPLLMILHSCCWCSCYCNVFHESHSKRSSCLANVEVITALALNFVHHPVLSLTALKGLWDVPTYGFLKTFVNFFFGVPTLNRDDGYELPVIYIMSDPWYKSYPSFDKDSVTIESLCLKGFFLSCKSNHHLLNLDDVIGYTIILRYHLILPPCCIHCSL